jgi:hypothetical protein
VRYFTNVGPDRGPVLKDTVPGAKDTVPGAIDVLEALDKPVPIGRALCTGRDATGIAVWRLVVHNATVPGRWIVVDREFQPAE